MEFDEHVTQYLRNETAYVNESKESLLYRTIAALSSVLTIGKASTHPYRMLQAEQLEPLQRAAVLKGVDARKARDSLEKEIMTAFPDAKESLKRRAEDCLLELHALEYEYASDEFYKEEKKRKNNP